MIRLLIAILLGAVISSQAPAQNRASQTLLALNEDERNTAVTRLLRESNEKCDQGHPHVIYRHRIGFG
jgi:hypothetical protein